MPGILSYYDTYVIKSVDVFLSKLKYLESIKSSIFRLISSSITDIDTNDIKNKKIS